MEILDIIGEPPFRGRMGSSEKGCGTQGVDSGEGGGKLISRRGQRLDGRRRQPLTLAGLEARVKEGAGGLRRKNF